MPWKTKSGRVAIVVGVVLLGAVALPLANLAAARETIAALGGPPAFATLSDTLQRKCVDCHAPELARMPLYARLPGASSLIQMDQRQASAQWTLSREELSGKRPLTDSQQAKLEWVLAAGGMPPPQYLVMHWTSSLSATDRAVATDYIAGMRRATPEAQSMAPAHRTEPVQVLLPPKGLNSNQVELGRLLFHDQRLSGDGSVSCATCHALNKGGTDQLPVSVGIHGQKGNVNDPSVFNSSYNILQFWDGRAADLEAQAGGPVENPVEMGAAFPAVIDKLKGVEDYVTRFTELYPGEGITSRTITHAIAEFERSLVTVGAPFDKYLMGDDAAISDVAKRGYALFKSTGCSQCHFGPAVGGRSFERFGVFRDYFADRGHVTEEDHGRFNVTHRESDRYRFKVPILRNATVTQPYFHDASAKDLTAAVSVMARYQIEDGLRPDEIAPIVSFIESLTGTYQGKPVDEL
jgi:cytochrome c peroxidase